MNVCVYICSVCNNEIHRNTNTSISILQKGLELFGLGIILDGYKLKNLLS
ncbi:hypothetical protein [Helicobacter pullorum]|nr:hypothetical protein [Helicobacter pullorum]